MLVKFYTVLTGLYGAQNWHRHRYLPIKGSIAHESCVTFARLPCPAAAAVSLMEAPCGRPQPHSSVYVMKEEWKC